MYVVQPPNRAPATQSMQIFLAGSIEQGKAEDWQQKFIHSLNGVNCSIYNPRRLDWNPDWTQSPENLEFSKQVSWEMDRITEADLIVFYFQPGTFSPISVGEFYYAAALGKPIMVCCPEGFWRKGNIDVVSLRHLNVRSYSTLDELIKAVKLVVINAPGYYNT